MNCQDPWFYATCVISMWSFFISWKLWLTEYNDWKITWTENGEWTDNNSAWEMCYYEIWYSPRRGEWKLEMGGHRPKQHSMYNIAVKKLNSFRITQENSQDKPGNV